MAPSVAPVKLLPAADGAADLSIEASLKGVRAGLAAAEGIDPHEVPPTSVDVTLQARGASPRQMAAGANGKVLVAIGPGKVKSGLVGMLGGGIFGQLASKLNPFSAKDPYTKLDCTVTRVDIVDGQVKVEPVLMQSEKVTVTADVSPRLGVGAKGAAAGGVAAATAGASVVVKGLVDRVAGEADLCQSTLEKATRPPKSG